MAQLNLIVTVQDGEVKLERQTQDFPYDDLPVAQRLIVNNLTDLYLEGKGRKRKDEKPSDS